MRVFEVREIRRILLWPGVFIFPHYFVGLLLFQDSMPMC